MQRPDDTLTDEEMILLHTVQAKTALEITTEASRSVWLRLVDLGFAKLTDHAPGDIERRTDAFVKISVAGRAYLNLNK